MKVYTYKCESCGSKQYIKTKTGYKCKYCGNTQDVIGEGVFEEDNVLDAGILNSSKQSPLNVQKKPLINARLKGLGVKFLVTYFIGIWGVHKFLEKKYMWGFAYMFTMGLFGIGWIVDICKSGNEFLMEWAEQKKRGK